jgi:cytochrome c oxidase subunit 2
MLQKRFLAVIAVLGLAALACGLTARSGRESSGDKASGGESSITATDGERLFNTYGCAECHNGLLDLAPSLEGVYGEEISLEGGETMIADEAYLRESILDPQAEIVSGYEPIMPEFEHQLSDEEVEALVEYIRSLSE